MTIDLDEIERQYQDHIDYEKSHPRPAITDHQFGLFALPFMRIMPELLRLARIGKAVEDNNNPASLKSED